ncbi:hypothetical protein [Streptomyces sp. NPDC058045]|uniref:hypothetical protein n=1 Tax=Streptomyces sp. NPDC058045 TaxID=3346311 RepID=UPI0036EADB67
MDTQTIEPGRYSYEIKVRFDSHYVPEHTPPSLRTAASYPTKRTRTVWGEFQLTQPLDLAMIRGHFIKQTRDELLTQDIEVLHFNLSPAG